MHDLIPMEVNLSFTGDDLVNIVAVIIIGAIILLVLKWALTKL